jgi:hypothetical protein
MFEDDDYEEMPDYPQPGQRQNPKQFYAEAAGTVLQALTEYARTLEKEKSSRADIERKRASALSVIHSQRHI